MPCFCGIGLSVIAVCGRHQNQQQHFRSLHVPATMTIVYTYSILKDLIPYRHSEGIGERTTQCKSDE